MQRFNVVPITRAVGVAIVVIGLAGAALGAYRWNTSEPIMPRAAATQQAGTGGISPGKPAAPMFDDNRLDRIERAISDLSRDVKRLNQRLDRIESGPGVSTQGTRNDLQTLHRDVQSLEQTVRRQGDEIRSMSNRISGIQR